MSTRLKYLKTIKARNVFGHILRHGNEPFYRIIEGKLEGQIEDHQERHLSNKQFLT